VSSSFTASSTGSLGTYNKRGSITKLQTLSCSLVVASKEEKTFVDIITLLGVIRSSIKYRMIDWLANHLTCWIQLGNRFLGLDTSTTKIKEFESSKYCHLKQSTNSFFAF
jgi:hypothetical protein